MKPELNEIYLRKKKASDQRCELTILNLFSLDWANIVPKHWKMIADLEKN